MLTPAFDRRKAEHAGERRRILATIPKKNA